MVMTSPTQQAILIGPAALRRSDCTANCLKNAPPNPVSVTALSISKTNGFPNGGILMSKMNCRTLVTAIVLSWANSNSKRRELAAIVNLMPKLSATSPSKYALFSKAHS